MGWLPGCHVSASVVPYGPSVSAYGRPKSWPRLQVPAPGAAWKGGGGGGGDSGWRDGDAPKACATAGCRRWAPLPGKHQRRAAAGAAAAAPATAEGRAGCQAATRRRQPRLTLVFPTAQLEGLHVAALALRDQQQLLALLHHQAAGRRAGAGRARGSGQARAHGQRGRSHCRRAAAQAWRASCGRPRGRNACAWPAPTSVSALLPPLPAPACQPVLACHAPVRKQQWVLAFGHRVVTHPLAPRSELRHPAVAVAVCARGGAGGRWAGCARRSAAASALRPLQRLAANRSPGAAGWQGSAGHQLRPTQQQPQYRQQQQRQRHQRTAPPPHPTRRRRRRGPPPPAWACRTASCRRPAGRAGPGPTAPCPPGSA